jgi:hypothetical protein
MGAPPMKEGTRFTMRSRLFDPRLLVGGALILGLLAAFSTPAVAQEVASLSIYTTECPAGFDGETQADLYNTCYGNPVAGQSFSAQQGKSDEAPAVAATDADGSVSLPLYAGSTTISEGRPQGVAEYFVFCSHQDGSAVEFEYTGDTFGIFLEVEGGDYYPTGSHVHCDWYNIPVAGDVWPPAAGTVSIYRANCPAGYDRTGYTDYYDDCFGNPAAGVQFVIREAGTDVAAGFSTGPDGNTSTTLPLSAPGTVAITETGAAGSELPPYQDYVVFCIKNGSEELPVDYGQAGVMDIVFDAAPGDAIGCDWFYVPPAGPDTGEEEPAGNTNLTIYATACPDGYQGDDYFTDCYGYPVEGVRFVAYRLKEDFFVDATTDADGFGTMTIPPSELYDGIMFGQSPNVEVPGGGDPPFAVYCTDEAGAEVNVGYSLIQLDPGGDAYSGAIEDLPEGNVRCDWYLLAADSIAEEDDGGSQPVTVLPNTGTGNGQGQYGAPLLAGLLVIAATLVGAASFVYRG